MFIFGRFCCQNVFVCRFLCQVVSNYCLFCGVISVVMMVVVMFLFWCVGRMNRLVSLCIGWFWNVMLFISIKLYSVFFYYSNCVYVGCLCRVVLILFCVQLYRLLGWMFLLFYWDVLKQYSCISWNRVLVLVIEVVGIFNGGIMDCFLVWVLQYFLVVCYYVGWVLNCDNQVFGLVYVWFGFQFWQCGWDCFMIYLFYFCIGIME